MGTLELDRVVKLAAGGQPALSDVSFSVGGPEFVTIRAHEPSGRTALMSVMSGIAAPDEGSAHFDGLDLFDHRQRLVPDRIAICWDRFAPTGGTTMLEQVAIPSLLAGRSRVQARRRAHETLARVGAERIADRHPHDVTPGELARAAVARALALTPAIVLANDLTAPAGLTERDALVALLRALTREDGIAVVLMGSQAIPGADRSLEVRGGRLLGRLHPLDDDASAAAATVIPIRRAKR